MDVITTHINADFDGLASMLAAKKLYPNAVLSFPGGQEKNLRDFFLQSTLYAFQTEKVKNIPLNKVKRLILVDIRQKGRIGKFATLCGRNDIEVHIYDHHPCSSDDISGKVEYIQPVGATATIMCQILKRNKISLTADEATILMLGIYEDTGNLTFASTTPEDYEAAAYLLSCGANLNIVSDMITKELTADQVTLLNQLVENISIKTINGIDIMITRASAESYVGEFSILVHKLKDMQNANVLFALANMDDRIYLIARSRIPEVNVADVLSEFGGGGHPTAAAVTIHDMTLAQVEHKLLDKLNRTIKPVKTAKDLMVAPVISIKATETVKKGAELLTRYNINVLPVVDKNSLVGLISRQIAEKALFHGLQNVPVREYMTTEFFTAKPSTPLTVIQKAIIENNQRFIPVLDRKKIVGAITRTDLLRALHVDTGLTEAETLSFAQTPRRKIVHSLLKERLSGRVFALLHQIGNVADSLGYNVYAVGGFVRDIFLRIENYDIDIVVEGDGIKFTRTFASQYPCATKVHRKFGTGVIVLPEQLKIDVASARLEYYEHPAAPPIVEWSSIKHDLYRRDFTINTLAIQLNKSSWGNLIDFFGAVRDIKEKFIRVLHNLSFVEDPSRVFRAIRFEQRLFFRFSKLTRSLIENAVKMDFIKGLSGKRLFIELQLILNEEKVLSIIKRMAEFGLLTYIHPSIQYTPALKTILKSCDTVLSWYDLLYLKNNVCERWLVFYLALTEQLSHEESEKLCTKFHMTKKDAEKVRLAKSQGLDILKWMLAKRTIKNSELYRQLNTLPTEVCLYIMAKTTHPDIRRAISVYFTHLRNISIHINGDDLIKMGIKPGKIYKRILEDLQDAVLDEKIAGREAELEYIRKKYAVYLT